VGSQRRLLPGFRNRLIRADHAGRSMPAPAITSAVRTSAPASTATSPKIERRRAPAFKAANAATKMTSTARPTASDAAKPAGPPVANLPTTKPPAAATPQTSTEGTGALGVTSGALSAGEFTFATGGGGKLDARAHSPAPFRGFAGTVPRRASIFAGQTIRQSMRSRRRRRTIGLR